MEDKKPSRQRKRKKSDVPSSSMAVERETKSKRSKRQEGETPLQKSSLGSSASRQEQPAEMDNKCEPSECMDERDKQMAGDGEDTCSDTHVETQDCSDTEDCKDQISRLPQLVQEMVFGFLSADDKIQAAQVCSDWCHAVFHPSLWRHQKVFVDLDKVTEKALSNLGERGISQIMVTGENQGKLKLLLKALPSLVSLHLGSNVTDIFLQMVSKCEFSSLKELSLKMEMYYEYVPSYFKRSLSSLSSLRKISIQGTVIGAFVGAIARELHGLEELSLEYFSLFGRPDDIRIRPLNSLRCLQSLSLCEVILLDFSDFCKENTGLKMLSLDHCELISADWADVAKLTSLEALTLEEPEPPGVGLESLKNLVNLKKLRLYPAEHEDFLSLASISSLEDVDITVDVQNPQTLETLQALGSNLAHLKALTLHEYEGGPPEVILHFARLPSLQKLSICCSETDEILKALSEGPCNLRSLHLIKVTVTSPLKLKYLAQISSLREVVLDSTDVSCSGLSSLQQATVRLETLELRYCKVTVESVMPLLRTQTSLQKLVIVGEEVRREDFPTPHAVLPNLEVCELRKSLEPGFPGTFVLW